MGNGLSLPENQKRNDRLIKIVFWGFVAVVVFLIAIRYFTSPSSTSYSDGHYSVNNAKCLAVQNPRGYQRLFDRYGRLVTLINPNPPDDRTLLVLGSINPDSLSGIYVIDDSDPNDKTPYALGPYESCPPEVK